MIVWQFETAQAFFVVIEGTALNLMLNTSMELRLANVWAIDKKWIAHGLQ